MTETMFVLKFKLQNNKTNKSKDYIYSSSCTTNNIQTAIKYFENWHKQNKWKSEWVSLKDYANDKNIKYKEGEKIVE